MQHHMPFGYRMMNGAISIIEERADIVRWIFQVYIEGMSLNKIAEHLIDRGIQSSRGKVTWTHGRVGTIINNRKYKGDALFPAIVSAEIFEKAQVIRGKVGQKACGKRKYFYSGKIICGECGGVYYRNGKEGCWICKNYIWYNYVGCRNPVIKESELETVGIHLLKNLSKNTRLYEKAIDTASLNNSNTLELDEKIQAEEERNSFSQLLDLYFRRAEERYAMLRINDASYLTQQITQALKQYAELEETGEEEALKEIVSSVTVHKDGRLVYRLINGIEIIEERGDKNAKTG